MIINVYLKLGSFEQAFQATESSSSKYWTEGVLLEVNPNRLEMQFVAPTGPTFGTMSGQAIDKVGSRVPKC